MNGRWFANIALTAAVAGLMSCSRAMVTGRVVDVFGKPIEGAILSIDGTSFAATTSGDGTYKIQFAPGQFKLKAKKDGYTSETVPFTVTESTRLPAANIVLYPHLTEAAIYYIGKDRLERLNDARLRRLDNFLGTPFPPGANHWELEGPSQTILPAGDATFINLLPDDITLARGTNGFQVVIKTSNASSESFISTKAEKVGDGTLEVRRVHLEPGDYGWIRLGRNLLGEVAPLENYSGFYVGEIVSGTIIAYDVVRRDDGLVIGVGNASEGGCPFFGLGHHGEDNWNLKIGDQVRIAGKAFPVSPENRPTGRQGPAYEVLASWITITGRK